MTTQWAAIRLGIATRLVIFKMLALLRPTFDFHISVTAELVQRVQRVPSLPLIERRRYCGALRSCVCVHRTATARRRRRR